MVINHEYWPQLICPQQNVGHRSTHSIPPRLFSSPIPAPGWGPIMVRGRNAAIPGWNGIAVAWPRRILGTLAWFIMIMLLLIIAIVVVIIIIVKTMFVITTIVIVIVMLWLLWWLLHDITMIIYDHDLTTIISFTRRVCYHVINNNFSTMFWNVKTSL